MAYTFNDTGSYRQQEKAEFQRLNTKLADYIQRMRSQVAGGQNQQAFLNSIKSLEDEVAKMTDNYERELNNLRQQLDEANRQKSVYAAQADGHKRNVVELEKKLKAAEERNRRLDSDVKDLQTSVANLEQKLAQSQAECAKAKAEVKDLLNEVHNVDRDNKELAQRLEKENAESKQNDEKAKALKKKQDFDDRRHADQVRGLQDRLNEANKVIQRMDEKAKEDEKKRGESIPALVQKIRDSTAKELQNAEDKHNRNLSALRSQLEDQNKEVDQLRADNTKLRDSNDCLLAQVRSLEREVHDLRKQNAVVEEKLRSERAKNEEQIRALQDKLQKLQDKFCELAKEADRESGDKATIETELETMRTLLEAEEARARQLQSGSRQGGYRAMTPGRGRPSSRSSANRNKIGKGDDKLSKSTGNMFRKQTPLTTYRASYGYPPFGRSQTTVSGLPIITGDGKSGRMNASYPKFRA